MSIQRFEVSATIGGFSAADVSGMEYRVFQERDGLRIPIPIIEQASRIQRAFRVFLAAIHTATASAAFCRETVLGEALPNLYIHGNKGNPELLSTVKMTVERQRTSSGERLRCILSIDDHSPVFGGVPDPTDKENLERPCGRGLLMMETFGATITQNEHPGGQSKTVVYTWDEESNLSASSESESDEESTSE